MTERTIIICENEYLKGKQLYKAENSQIELVKKEFFVPEKKIILPEDFSGKETAYLRPEIYTNGGIII